MKSIFVLSGLSAALYLGGSIPVLFVALGVGQQLIPSNWKFDQQETYRGSALLFVDYPDSIARGDVLQFWADKYHIRELGARLKFIRAP